MQIKHWWFTLALLFIQLIKRFVCVEPVTITLGAAVAGGSVLACKNIFWIFHSSFVCCFDRFWEYRYVLYNLVFCMIHMYLGKTVQKSSDKSSEILWWDKCKVLLKVDLITHIFLRFYNILCWSEFSVFYSIFSHIERVTVFTLNSRI